MNRCFLMQPPSEKHDMTDLSEFGVPIVLFGRGYFPDDVYQYTDKIIQILDDKLLDFNPDNDYFVPLGDSCVVGQVVAWAAAEGLLPVKFLKYDRKLRGYYTVKIGI